MRNQIKDTGAEYDEQTRQPKNAQSDGDPTAESSKDAPLFGDDLRPDADRHSQLPPPTRPGRNIVVSEEDNEKIVRDTDKEIQGGEIHGI